VGIGSKQPDESSMEVNEPSRSGPRRVTPPDGGTSGEVAARQPGDPRPLVLLVDDDPDARRLFADGLRRRGFRVEEARNGFRAIELAKRLLPAAIVIDRHMPGLDGWEAVQRMKAEGTLRAIPVLALTADIDYPSVRGALEVGCDGFVAKPVTPHELVSAVERVLGTSAAEDPTTGVRERP
jgi:CheY-like chemotaxis protein